MTPGGSTGPTVVAVAELSAAAGDGGSFLGAWDPDAPARPRLVPIPVAAACGRLVTPAERVNLDSAGVPVATARCG
jgi:hypothetical protein